MKSLGDYHNLYLKMDVLLLTDVFEKLINWSLKCYGLGPCHNFSSSGLSWDAILKMTEIELEPIPDINMHLLIEVGMRGGIYYIARYRYSKANNKYMQFYDDKNPSKYIIYLDVNSL